MNMTPPTSVISPIFPYTVFTDEEIEQSIPARFEQQVRVFGDRQAIVTPEVSLTYERFNAMANQLARKILALRGDCVEPIALLLDHGASVLVAMFAVLKTGKFYLVLDPTYPRDRLAAMLQDSGAQLVISDTKNLALVGQLSDKLNDVVDLDRLDDSIPKSNLGLKISPDALAMLLYTSGSTGQPKGVMHSHKNVLVEVRNLTNVWRISSMDRWLLYTSMSFAHSVRTIYGGFLNGSAVFPYNLKEKGFADLTDCLVANKITLMRSLPTTFRNFMATLPTEQKFPEVRVLAVGGEPLTRADVESFNQHFCPPCVLVHGLGPTECFMVCLNFLPHGTQIEESKLSIGYPLPDKQVLLLNDEGVEVPPGGIGQICVKSRYIALGYWRDPERTNAVFRADPLGSGARIYRTGDLGVRAPDGCLTHVGRQDFQMKVRGFRIDPGDVECALRTLDGVHDAAVIGQETAPGENRLIAYFVSAPGSTMTATALRHHLAQLLPDYMIPAVFLRIDAVPHTPNGKLDRRALPNPGNARPDLDTAYVAPSTDIQQQLSLIWREVLSLDSVGIHDNFFDLGGDSLTASRVISRITQSLNIGLSLKVLFESPTVAQLAEVIAVHRERPSMKANTQAISRRKRVTPAPLSFAQQRLWFLHQLEPESPAYNEASARRFCGKLNVATLNHALNEIVARHEVLRSTFGERDGEPVPTIAQAATIEMPLVDLSNHAETDRCERAHALMVETARRPFVLSREFPLRPLLLRLGPDEHILLLVYHHIASDGWSSHVFWRDLTRLYGAFAQGETSPLAELAIQYQDYAEWQRHWLQGEILKEQLAYWKKQLDGVAPLQLPTDYPRPAIQCFNGAKKGALFPKELAERLKNLSRNEGATLFMTLLAAFQTLLYRYAGQEDIAVGCPVAGRVRPETEELIGFFVNTLVVRTQLQSQLSFRELLQRVRETALAAYDHQELPFEKLVAELSPARDLSRNPLFQVAFQLRNYPTTAAQMHGITIEPLELNIGTAKFDLSLGTIEDSRGLAVQIEYRTDLFEAATIERMMVHFQTQLEGIADDPDNRLSQLPLLSAAEKHQILEEWNDTQIEYPADKCIHQLFEQQVERTPDAIALVYGDRQLSYRELDNKANQLASYLRKLGVGPEVVVGICVERSIEMIVGLLGILKAGGAYIPLDPAYPWERLRFMVEDARATVVVTQAKLIEDRWSQATDFAVPVKWVCLDREWGKIALENNDPLATSVSSRQLAYVIYTSGSTGNPKGVAIEHRNAVAFLSWVHSAFSCEELSRVLASTSICFDLSVFEIFAPLACGGTVLLVENALALATMPKSTPVTLLNTVPSAMTELLQLNAVPPSVQVINLAGEPLRSELVRQIYQSTSASKVYDLYGPSECTTYSTCALRTADGPQTIGQPIGNTQIYILDAHLNPVPIGVVGEIYIGGDGVARGYLNQPEMTPEKFIDHCFAAKPAQRLYRSGDLARYWPDGNIEFVGRIDNQVKIRGYRVELGEIEHALNQHDGVRQSVVTIGQDSAADRQLVAYVVAAAKAASQEDLRSYLKTRLPDYMVPGAFVFLDALPLNANGKVNRKALPDPDCKDSGPAEAYVAPRNAVEETIAELWHQVLGKSPIGVHDDFFELGGHSLKATQVIARLRAKFRAEIPLSYLFEYPTIAQLAAALLSQTENNLDITQLLEEIEAMSEDEARAFIAPKASSP